MSPTLVAFIIVIALFAGFWATRPRSNSGAKWGLRVAMLVLSPIAAAVLSSEPAAAVVAGQYVVYFGIAAIVVYQIAVRSVSS